jgi:hypothetical protein
MPAHLPGAAQGRQPGRHFLQIPGPTNVPDRVLGTIALPTIDHRGPAFEALAREVLSQIRTIFKTEQPVVIYPSVYFFVLLDIAGFSITFVAKYLFISVSLPAVFI